MSYTYVSEHTLNLTVVVETENSLCTLSEVEPHPRARVKVPSYTFAPGNGTHVEALGASVAGSRLAVLRKVSDISATQVVIWDWVTGQILAIHTQNI